MEPEKKPQNKIGLITATAFVSGNMIGSGVFLLPSALAAFGSISFLGWLLSGTGALFLAIVFSRLSRMMPKAGGPYAYTRAAYGDFAGFLVSWGYWVSIWCGNAAIAVGFASYLSVFFPALEKPALAGAVAIAALWLLTWVNLRGIKSSGKVQVVSTALKLLPLMLIGVMGLFYIDVGNFFPTNVSEKGSFDAITATATLTLWAFLGMESATIPADQVDNPKRTIARATLIGTGLALAVYLLSSVAIMGMIPNAQLQNSTAPFADAAYVMWGDVGRYFIAFGAVAATFGALNGWILLQGQVPMAISKDKLFPAVFEKENKHGAPALGLVITSVLVTLLVLSNYSKGLVGMFTFMILLSTTTVLVPYLFSALAEILIAINKGERTNLSKPLIFALPAFAYSIWAISGSGKEPVFYGFILLMAGIPIYVWTKYNRS